MCPLFEKGMTDNDDEKTRDRSEEKDHYVENLDRVDKLREELMKRREEFDEKILTSARLISPLLGEKDEWMVGYKWVMDQLKPDFEVVASKLEMVIVILLYCTVYCIIFFFILIASFLMISHYITLYDIKLYYITSGPLYAIYEEKTI